MLPPPVAKVKQRMIPFSLPLPLNSPHFGSLILLPGPTGDEMSLCYVRGKRLPLLLLF